MKLKKIILLASVALFSLTPGNTIYAISGPDETDTRAVEPSGRYVSINVNGIVVNDQKQVIEIPTVDLELNEKELSRDSIQKAIQDKLDMSAITYGQYYTVDNLENLTMVDEFGQTYPLTYHYFSLGYFTSNEKTGLRLKPRKFSLNGTIYLKEVSTDIITPAKEVNVDYSAGFTIVNANNEAEQYYPARLQNNLYKTLQVGEELSSSYLLDLAHRVLAESRINYNNNNDPYIIVKRNQTEVSRDQDAGAYASYETLYSEYDPNLRFDYRVKERQLQQVPSMEAKTLVNNNTDSISEKYTLVKKSQLNTWLAKQNAVNLKPSTIVYYYHDGLLVDQKNLENGFQNNIISKNGQTYIATAIMYLGDQLRVNVVPKNKTSNSSSRTDFSPISHFIR